jgi:uncharacterized membrane protein YdbT with pleckstrin-like domain
MLTALPVFTFMPDEHLLKVLSIHYFLSIIKNMNTAIIYSIVVALAFAALVAVKSYEWLIGAAIIASVIIAVLNISL